MGKLWKLNAFRKQMPQIGLLGSGQKKRWTQVSIMWHETKIEIPQLLPGGQHWITFVPELAHIWAGFSK